MKKTETFTHWLFFVLCFWHFQGTSLFSQTSADTSFQSTFKAGAELRTRTEWRDGYRLLPDSLSNPAFFTAQRTRLNLEHRHKSVNTSLSIQDSRVWGDREGRDITGTFTIFKAWFELPLAKKWSARIGRQPFFIDNQRLFAENNWRTNANAHDGARFQYRTATAEGDMFLAFNQTEERNFGTDYDALTALGHYKFLNVLWYKQAIGTDWTLSLIHALDGFQSDKSAAVLYVRETGGGRVEWEKGAWYATFSGYWQRGSNQKGKEIKAYYLQPELRYGVPNQPLVFRLGLEYLSGQDAQRQERFDHSFVPLYGVAHRFMGNLDFFTRFPADLKGAGLINPYFFSQYQLGKKWAFKGDFHVFYLQKAYTKAGQTEPLPRYMGFEMDAIATYQLNKETHFELGYCWAAPTSTLAAIRGGQANQLAQWAYLQITVKPEFFTIKK